MVMDPFVQKSCFFLHPLTEYLSYHQASFPKLHILVLQSNYTSYFVFLIMYILTNSGLLKSCLLECIQIILNIIVFIEFTNNIDCWCWESKSQKFTYLFIHIYIDIYFWIINIDVLNNINNYLLEGKGTVMGLIWFPSLRLINQKFLSFISLDIRKVYIQHSTLRETDTTKPHLY
jgi:hypothetical protein